VLAVVRVLDGGPARLGQGEHTVILPVVGGGEGALGCKDTHERQEESVVLSLAVVAARGKGARDSERMI
jgi:hypothetical protein